MNQGPDEDATTVDHVARLQTAEMEFQLTGTLPDESIRYLLNQAAWAIRLDDAGTRLADAAMAYVTELEGELAESHAVIRILRTSLSTVLDKVEETPAND